MAIQILQQENQSIAINESNYLLQKATSGLRSLNFSGFSHNQRKCSRNNLLVNVAWIIYKS